VQHVGRGVKHLAHPVSAEFADGGVALFGDVVLDDAPNVLVRAPRLAVLDGLLPACIEVVVWVVVVWCG
jgi:hypothetical protein